MSTFRAFRAAALAAAFLPIAPAPAGDDDAAALSALGAEYQQTARVLVRRACFECHSTDTAEAGVDLERFATLDDLRADARTWMKVVEQLETGEMPPDDASEALAPDDRTRLRDWVKRFLRADAQGNAGDPGPVVLRRLTNDQYTYTVRDLTGLGPELDPAREFPTDGAAGEGFTNTGNALVMSPSLLDKYLEAGKEISRHVELLPDGLRFARGTSNRDFTDEAMARIRALYARYTEASEGNQVNLQGIVFNTNGGGRLPIEKYLAALLDEKARLAAQPGRLAGLAAERGLSPKYLQTLWNALQEPAGSGGPLMEHLRAGWRQAGPGGAEALVAQIVPWQSALWRFNSVGQIGKVGGPKSWMEPVAPLAESVAPSRGFPADTPPGPDGLVHLTLAASHAGAWGPNDAVVWDEPRLVTPGRPDLPLKEVRKLVAYLTRLRGQSRAHAAAILDSAAQPAVPAAAETAERLGVDPQLVAAWYAYLGVGSGPALIAESAYLRHEARDIGKFAFVTGFDSPDLPSISANASNEHVRIPGNLKPHGVAVHPTPELRVATAWRSPIEGPATISAAVQHAHPECGNGVTWELVLRTGNTRQKLASGVATGPNPFAIGPFPDQRLRKGDLLCLSIGPRDRNHACDLTAIDMKIEAGGAVWDLAADVSPDILAGNPHSDRQGNAAVWHFYREPDTDATTDSVVPPGSLLAQWRNTADPAARSDLARQIAALLAGPTPDASTPDGALYRQLTSLRGPLLARVTTPPNANADADADADPRIGIDPARFGRLPDGGALSANSLAVRPLDGVVDIALPPELLAGTTFQSGGRVHSDAGSAQLFVRVNDVSPLSGLVAGTTIVARPGPGQDALARDIDVFRGLFPPALCYTRIVPVDEVITLTLHHREDGLLQRLMLSEAETAELNREWDVLRFVSRDALTLVDALQQLLEYASQDADPSVFAPLKEPFAANARDFRNALAAAEPVQLDAAIRLAATVYRRPLLASEEAGLRALYQTLRDEELPHDEALRLLVARLFVAPDFLYRVEKPASAGTGRADVSGPELASRLSYFLWASLPDAELTRAGQDGSLAQPAVLKAQAQRMLADPRAQRLAEQFACQWLQVYDFPRLDEKSERHFPTFLALREAMYQETILFFTDVFQNDRSVLELLDCDDTFLNEELARHYEIPNVTGPEWRKVTGVRQYGRGGILGLATTLAKQSGASRTSPILRGNWLSEVLLGDRLPRPPKDVPQLPDDDGATATLTVRQLVEKHTSDPRCAGCHVRIDPFGFSLEAYDAIGRFRARDEAGRPIDTHAKLPDGTELDGLDSLRHYLLTTQRDAFVRQFCRKLLGYALGRGVLLTDEPLLDQMQERLRAADYHVSAALGAILESDQFRKIRGLGHGHVAAAAAATNP